MALKTTKFRQNSGIVHQINELLKQIIRMKKKMHQF